EARWQRAPLRVAANRNYTWTRPKFPSGPNLFFFLLSVFPCVLRDSVVSSSALDFPCPIVRKPGIFVAASDIGHG
ncbi:MAG: hypothetical protein ACYC3I_10970, partial [Gemmataceae bacterium]